MPNFNRVILAGNLTRDPELRYTPKGTAVAKITLAINRTWRDESNQTHEEVTFVDVDVFGRQAETIAQYLKKGRPILVEGRLKYDTWEDKTTNQKRSKLGVVLEGFQFLDSGQGRENAGAPPDAASRPSRPSSAAVVMPPPPAEPEGMPPEEDDVPF